MKKITLFIFLLICLIGFQKTGYCQSQSDIRINEIVSINQNSLMDNFGHHIPWVEIFNSSYGTVNISGMYLTDDPKNLKKYAIPSDGRMLLSPQSYLIFFFDGNSEHSVLHTNFKLDSTGFVALVASNGKTIVDSVSFKFTKSDEVFRRVTDGNGKWELSSQFTPNQTNVTEKKVTNAELFVQYDPIGIGMAIISMLVVMVALMLLYLLFKYLARVYKSEFQVQLKKKKDKKASDEDTDDEISVEELNSEVNAAIALAVHLYRNQLHDEEEAVLTIKKVTKTYSPWSSKLYMLRQIPSKPSQNPYKTK